jgi:hypothetical protein
MGVSCEACSANIEKPENLTTVSSPILLRGLTKTGSNNEIQPNRIEQADQGHSYLQLMLQLGSDKSSDSSTERV